MTARRGKKPPASASPAILERNLERYPWARLSDDKGDQLRLELLFEAAGEEGRAWTVAPGKADRLPGPFDADLYVALCQLFNVAGRPNNRTVQTSFRELADLMHRPPGGGWYEAIAGGLDRLAQVSIRAVQTWREGEYIAAVKTAHLVEAVEIGIRRDKDENGTRVRVRFSEEVAESIAAGNFRLLDTAEYFALQTPTARRLYRYLDYRRWRGTERLSSVRFPLKRIAEELPIDRSSPSHIKRTLDPAHALLTERGFLAAAEYEEQPVAGKKRPEQWVVYRFGEPAPIPLPVAERGAPQGQAEDGERLRQRVAEILQLLKDERSAAFYVKAVKVLPDTVLEGVIGGVRQSLREGVELDVARKLFTRTVQTRAKAIGVEL